MAENRFFTLIELLVTITIIIILSGLTIAGVRFAFRRSEETVILSRMRKMELALESYRRDWGYYPISPDPSLSAEDMDVDDTSSNDDGKVNLNVAAEAAYFHIDFVLEDPQGKPYLEETIDADNPYRQSPSGTPFFYQYPSSSLRELKNSEKYDLWAAGVDGTFNTSSLDDPPFEDNRTSEDDYNNWSSGN